MDFQAIANAVRQFAQEGTTFLYLAALAAGLWLGLSALLKVARRGLDRGGDSPDNSWGAIGGRLLISSCLVTMANKMDMFIATNGSAQGVRSMLDYAGSTVTANSNPVLQSIWAACATFLVFLGTVAFLRGLFKFDKACQGGHDSGDAFWSGLWHVIGGALTVAIFS